MLTVKRKPGEAIIIGDRIVVTVVGVSGKHVEINITAPEGIAIDREEVAYARALGVAPTPKAVRA
jgi:carbon storage regulator